MGCVVASRLADADPKLSILVFEGGPNNQGNPATTYPALYRGNFMPDSNTANIYMSTAEEQLSGRASIVVSGSVLGGSSCVNGLIYTRAQRDDYNSWNAAGWSADELLPYLKKVTSHGGHHEGVD